MESTDKDLGRLKTLCRGLFFVLLILTVLVAMVICILVSGVAIEVLEPGTVSDEVGIPHGNLLSLMGFGIVSMSVSLVVLIMMMNISGAIHREYSPFTGKNVKRLEVVALAYLLLPVVVAPMVYSVVGELTAFDVVVLSFASVLLAMVFYCLSLVFRYGSWLQKESDETL